MTFQVLESIIDAHPIIVECGTLVIRSDNCCTQYKSKYTFANMERLAKKHNIDIYWFYGAAGHGRGLVDAMSSFGCKGPLRKYIITDNKFFNDANEIFNYLDKHFEFDESKMYYLIDEEENAKIRKKESNPQLRLSHPIAGSSKLHLIAVTSKGEWFHKIALDTMDQNVMNLCLDDSEEDENETDYSDEQENENIYPNGPSDGILDVEKPDFKFEFAEESTFIALPTSSGFETFYLLSKRELQLKT